MTATNNPYHDEDAMKIDIDTKMIESPFVKTMKHLGDTIKGGFCNPSGDELKAEQISKTVDTAADESYSSSDESVSVVNSEKERENVDIKQCDSVTINADDSEPLIVAETPEPQVVEIEVVEPKVVEPEIVEPKKTEQKTEVIHKSRAILSSIDEEEEHCSSYMSLTSLVQFIAVAAVAAMYKFDLFDMTKITNLLVDRFEGATEKDISTLASAAFGFTAFSVFMRTFFSSEKRVKPILEFVWGIFVYSIVATGVYFTYDLTTN